MIESLIHFQHNPNDFDTHSFLIQNLLEQADEPAYMAAISNALEAVEAKELMLQFMAQDLLPKCKDLSQLSIRLAKLNRVAPTVFDYVLKGLLIIDISDHYLNAHRS